MKATDLINQRVKIKCPAYNRGRTCYGVVKSIKKETPLYITYMVLVDGNQKCKSLAGAWLTKEATK
jgi:hypothetical protein